MDFAAGVVGVARSSAGEEFVADVVKVAVIVTGMDGIVAVVVANDEFARIMTSPVQPAN